MRKRASAALAGVVAIIAVASYVVPGSAATNPTPNTPTCPPDSLGQARSIIHDSYALKRYKQKPAIGPASRAQLDALKACVSYDEAVELRKYEDEKHHDLGVYRAYRKVTPYKCTKGAWGYWAIDCGIISCESGFSWTARNPSGASGPYQLLGWGAIYPARTREQQLQNHRLAAKVWAGGAGRSNWVC